MSSNRAYRLAQRPVGLPTADTFELTEESVGEPADGQVLVEVQYLSLDPAMRGWMNDAPSYTPPVGLGEVMRAIGAGRVVASRDGRYAEGDHVVGLLGVQEYAVVGADGLSKADPDLAPLPKWLGILGMPGLTAYFGLLDIGRPEPGQTVVVSAAAGAVGSLVGQIAKLQGARAVGIAGGPEKCAYLTERAGLRRGRRLQERRTCRRRCARPARRASTSTSTTSGARSSTRRWRSWRSARGW